MTKSTITREESVQAVFDLKVGYRLGFADIEILKRVARMALAAMDSDPAIADCDPEVYEKGVSVCLVAIPKETAEIICQNITAATGCKVDWHYFGGRVHIKALRESSQPAPEYPEVLPCPVLLEPGLRFGKGIKTSTVLAALARRAVYESDMAALTPEERAEFQAGIEDFKALISQPEPLVMDDKKLRELFDAWFASDCSFDQSPEASEADNIAWRESYWYVWQRCRAAMLQELQKSAGTEAICRSDENVQVLHTKSPAQSDCCPAKNSVTPAQNSVTPAQNQGWIPVSEQMPGRYYVLAADFSGRHYPPSQPNTQVGIHDDWFGDGKPTWDDGDGNDLHLKQVTHWMPLPAAPQEVQGD
ncbi:TPA: DUF551 domain-containing protein [Klebsiella aerogenes]|nr:DUF551 domain-containing protein [Klebsiella aerogenes]